MLFFVFLNVYINIQSVHVQTQTFHNITTQTVFTFVKEAASTFRFSLNVDQCSGRKAFSLFLILHNFLLSLMVMSFRNIWSGSSLEKFSRRILLVGDGVTPREELEGVAEERDVWAASSSPMLQRPDSRSEAENKRRWQMQRMDGFLLHILQRLFIPELTAA